MSKLRVFESFSGVGSMSMALRNLGIDFEVVGISEVDKWALLSYDAIHNEQIDVILPTKEEMLQLNPILMINEFSKTHHVQFDADAEKDKQNYLLNLFPKDNKFDHFKVAIVVQKETKQVKKITIKYKNGTSTTFESSNFNSAAKLTDTDFTFDSKKYPNIEINDLR